MIIATIDQIIDETGGAFYGMVVNAGCTHHKAALDFTKEDIEMLFNVNLFGAFYTARAAARAFLYQARNKRIYCFHCLNGLLSSQQGFSSHIPFQSYI